MSTVRHSLLAPPADRPGSRPGISRRRVIRAFGALGLAGVATVGYGAGIDRDLHALAVLEQMDVTCAGILA